MQNCAKDVTEELHKLEICNNNAMHMIYRAS